MSDKFGAVPAGMKRRPGVAFGCGNAKCAACYEPVTVICMDASLQQTVDYLHALPGVLALYWFMENVGTDDPNRSTLFFYCRERVRRYQSNSAHPTDKPWEIELESDAEKFNRMYGGV